jgi:hypothetical protein
VAAVSLAATLALLAACAPPAEDAETGAMETEAVDAGMAAGDMAQGATGSVERGRLIVIHHGCGDCHGGVDNPAAPGFLAGQMTPLQEFPIQLGPDQPVYLTHARNITPDNDTGIGRFTERQIFNALRYGLRPGETPDAEITSNVPGQGNFPASPKYLAPPMPWPAFRHMSDQELMDIAAYLKRGVRPVVNQVLDSEGPPDFWAAFYAMAIGTYPLPPFPAAQEIAGP